MFHRLAIPFTLVLLVVVAVLRERPENTAGVKLYHEQIADLVGQIPVDTGGWEGQEVPIPQSATDLLRPNALVSRRYVHASRGVSGTLLVVQCRDARDMAGHYPPRCYPGNGWLPPQERAFEDTEIGGRTYRKYNFSRETGRSVHEIQVYSLFVLPTGSTTTSMSDVYALSADMENRHLGAAQIQFVVDREMEEDELRWLLEEFAALVEPVVHAIEFPELSVEVDEGDES